MLCNILPPMRRRVILEFLVIVCLSAQLHAQEPVCALSDKQQQDAPKAFAKLAPIFTHPRCFNCHGGVVPFNNSRRGPHPEIASDGVVLGTDGGEDFAATFRECGDCHDAFPSANSPVKTWRLAPFSPDMQFNVRGTTSPKSTLELCKQMKTRVRVPGAAGFIGHMKDDNGDRESPFLNVAFAGTLGWDPSDPDNSSNIDLAKNAFGSYPAPRPPMTQEQALQQAKDWVAAMGGKFRQPEECGCAEKKYALLIHAHGTASFQGLREDFRLVDVGRNLPKIPLTFKDDGSFSGQVNVGAESTSATSVPVIGCNGQTADQVQIVANGSWADITSAASAPTSDPPIAPRNPIKVKLKFSQIATQATETCIFPIVGSRTTNDNQRGPATYTFDLVFPNPVVKQTAVVPWNAPPWWLGEVRAELIEVLQSGQP